jgi:hypothetical protein
MFSKIRKRLTYANVAMTLALVFAMSGGAYAASKYLITSTKQIKPSVLKSLKGKAGATGAAGAQGAQGLKGETGASVTGKEGPEGKAGKDGKEGPQGPPGTTGFTETLPSGKTLKGDWNLLNAEAPGAHTIVEGSVSFGIPLGEAPTPHYIRTNGLESILNAGTVEEVTPTQCLGSAAEPTANPGNLCVYARQETNTIKESGTLIFPKTCAFGNTGACLFLAASADPYGFGLFTLSEAPGPVILLGSWAVTAE